MSHQLVPLATRCPDCGGRKAPRAIRCRRCHGLRALEVARQSPAYALTMLTGSVGKIGPEENRG